MLAEIVRRDQLGFVQAAFRRGAGDLVVVVVGESLGQAEFNAAVLEEFHRLRRPVDEREHPVLLDLAAAEIVHVGDDLVARVLVAFGLFEMVHAGPEAAMRRCGAAAEFLRLFEYDGL